MKYQNNYSQIDNEMYNRQSRSKKARAIIDELLRIYSKNKLKTLKALDVGASTGYIDNYLSSYFKGLTGVDIDAKAIGFAKAKFKKNNLKFKIGNAMKLGFKENSFDVVICTQVYEHVPNANFMFNEIYRVLKPGGICYLSAMNSLWPWEPHYHLPFLSYLSKKNANLYVSLLGRSKEYYETPTTYWGIKHLARKFKLIDCTRNYMPSILSSLAPILKYFMPTTFWILTKEK